jgi:hypothetical protein
MKSQIKSYDPRSLEDYCSSNFTTKNAFSSIEHGFYVLDCVGKLDWSSEIYLLTVCIQNTGKQIFFMVDPWQSKTEGLKNALENEFGRLFEFENSVCGYTDIASDAVGKVLQIRAMFGGDSSGQWCIGGCLDKFTMPRRTSFAKGELWDLPFILGQPQKIGCVLWLGEMQQSLFATRLFVGFDNLLQQSSIMNLIRQPNHAR